MDKKSKILDLYIRKSSLNRLYPKALKALFFLVFFMFVSCGKAELKKCEKEEFLFGTSIKIVMYSEDEKEADKLMKDTFQLMKGIESRYNSRNAGSIVYKLNANPAARQKIDQEFNILINNVLKLSDLTEGRFDITIEPVMSLWGFDNLEIDKVPSKDEILKKLELVNYKDIKLTKDSICLSKAGQKIDTGSFLKGFAIAKGKEFLAKEGVKSAMITAVSSIDTIGSKPDGNPFKIGVQNPKNSEELLYTVELDGKALGVAGDYQTFVEINGKKYHHIIDATTGYPSGYNSMVLVFGESAYQCDLYDTAFFTLPAEQILKIVEKMPGFEVFIVDKQGKEYFSANIKKYLKKFDEKK